MLQLNSYLLLMAGVLVGTVIEFLFTINYNNVNNLNIQINVGFILINIDICRFSLIF